MKVDILDVIGFYNENGYDLKTMELSDFLKYLKDNYKREEAREILHYTGILKSSNSWTKFNVLGNKTEMILKKLGFEWEKLNKDHIFKMVNYLKDINYL